MKEFFEQIGQNFVAPFIQNVCIPWYSFSIIIILYCIFREILQKIPTKVPDGNGKATLYNLIFDFDHFQGSKREKMMYRIASLINVCFIIPLVISGIFNVATATLDVIIPITYGTEKILVKIFTMDICLSWLYPLLEIVLGLASGIIMIISAIALLMAYGAIISNRRSYKNRLVWLLMTTICIVVTRYIGYLVLQI